MTSRSTPPFSERILTVAAVLAIPVMLLALWRGSAELRAGWKDTRKAQANSLLVDSVFSARDDQVTLGSGAATVTALEFMDYERPGCRAAHGALKLLLDRNPGARIAIVHFPLDASHSSATLAAKLAICAEDQGAFVAAHQFLLVTPSLADTAALLSHVGDSLNLDTKRLRECVGGNATERRLALDRALGERVGIQGTPTFLTSDGKQVGLGALSNHFQEKVGRENIANK